MAQGDDLRYLPVVLVLFGILWPARWAWHPSHLDHPLTVAGDYGKTASADEIEAESIVSLYGPYLMKILGVWGVGAYVAPDGNWYIRVMAEAITPEIKRGVPKTLGRFPVVIVVEPRPRF
jgi:hypothetical protein